MAVCCCVHLGFNSNFHFGPILLALVRFGWYWVYWFGSLSGGWIWSGWVGSRKCFTCCLNIMFWLGLFLLEQKVQWQFYFFFFNFLFWNCFTILYNILENTVNSMSNKWFYERRFLGMKLQQWKEYFLLYTNHYPFPMETCPNCIGSHQMVLVCQAGDFLLQLIIIYVGEAAQFDVESTVITRITKITISL